MSENLIPRQQSRSTAARTDLGERPAAESEPPQQSFVVPCPACAGFGRVLPDGSQVWLGCRLCWERGLVGRIAARQYLRRMGAATAALDETACPLPEIPFARSIRSLGPRPGHAENPLTV